MCNVIDSNIKDKTSCHVKDVTSYYLDSDCTPDKDIDDVMSNTPHCEGKTPLLCRAGRRV